jgi:hypothetical protein
MRRSGKTEGNKIQSSSSSVEITQKRGAPEPARVSTVIAVAMMPQMTSATGIASVKASKYANTISLQEVPMSYR